MLQSFFTGLTGMFNFSKSLDNVSNNITNMNTPGYRGTDTFLRSLTSGDQGIGTALENSSTRIQSGEIRQTGSSTDLAITGKGMFVLRNEEGETFYTRAGQFSLNADNELVDSNTGMNVMAISKAGNLEIIDISAQKALPPEATTEVKLSGILSSTDTTKTISPVIVYDATGTVHQLTLNLENPTTTTDIWTVEIEDEDGNLLDSGEIRFDSSGTLVTGFNSISADLTFAGVTQTVNFNFGAPASFTDTTQASASTSTIGVKSADGHGILGIVKVSFDDKGVMQIKYSNGDVNEGQQIALAGFSNEANLRLADGGFYQTTHSMPADYGRPGDNILGSVQGNSIELSNVDLTQEFADIMIIQRGYQASSRAMTVSNELIEQLYNNTRG